MKFKILSIATTMCFFSIANTYATTYYSDQNSDGYSASSGSSTTYESRVEPQNRSQISDGYSTSSGPSATYESRREPKRRSHISVSVNTRNHAPVYEHETYYVPRHPSKHRHKHQVRLQWAFMGPVLSEDAVIGGGEYNRALYICRGKYRGGIHPGKLVGNRCNIGWDGREISLTRFEILESHKILNWVPASHGDIPVNAVQGGIDERGTPLYVCQTTYRGGMHPGKIVEQACQIPWRGKEIANPYYQVLVS